MHNDSRSSSSSGGHHQHHDHGGSGEDSGGHNSLFQGLAAGYADLTQDLNRNKSKGSKPSGGGRNGGPAAGSGQDSFSMEDTAPSPTGTSASLASSGGGGGGGRNSSSGTGWLGKSSSSSSAAAGFWVKERELVLLVESFRRGPGRQLLVCVTTHRVVCAEGARSGGELALTLEWAMPVRRVEPLLR